MVAFGKNLGKIGIEWGITCPNGIVGFGKGKCFLALILDWVPFLSLFLPLLQFFVFCFFVFYPFSSPSNNRCVWVWLDCILEFNLKFFPSTMSSLT